MSRFVFLPSSLPLSLTPSSLSLSLNFALTDLMITATIEETHFLTSRLLSVHSRYYVREMRIRAYGQLLESYRSVTLISLAEAFGVSVGFMDSLVFLFFFSSFALVLPPLNLEGCTRCKASFSWYFCTSF